MQTGTALFFGLTMIAFAIIFAATKDRWKFKKIGKIILIILCIVIVIYILAWVYVFIENKIINRPIKQTELEGISLGDSKDDVIFKKGNPDSFEEEKDLRSGAMEYHLYDSDLLATIENNKVKSVLYKCEDGASYGTGSCPYYFKINGVSFKDSFEVIEKKLGKPSQIKCSPVDKTFRVYTYYEYQTEYVINKDGVLGVIIFDSNLGEGSSLKECN